MFLPTIPILNFMYICKQKHTYFYTNLDHWNVLDFLKIFSNQKVWKFYFVMKQVLFSYLPKLPSLF